MADKIWGFYEEKYPMFSMEESAPTELHSEATITEVLKTYNAIRIKLENAEEYQLWLEDILDG